MPEPTADETPREPAPADREGGEQPARRPPSVRRGRSGDEQPTIAHRSSDDSDLGWGDEPGGRDAQWYERQRPPHHE